MLSHQRSQGPETGPLCPFCRGRTEETGRTAAEEATGQCGEHRGPASVGWQGFPVGDVHREQVDPGVCWIGRVQGVDRGRVSLLEIGPDAIWEDTPEEYRIKEITRVNFGGDYENALHLVGGEPTVA